MNPYFLLLYIATAMYRWLDFSNVLHLAMAFIKNVKLLGSLLVPDAKGTIEHLRDGILKINYVDPDNNANQGKGVASAYFLLPHAVPALNWTKVYAITIEQYNKGHQDRIDARIEVNRQQAEAENKSIDGVDPDLLADIAEAETHQAGLEVVSTRKPAKISLKGFDRTDVTDFIEKVAGPGKDFFGCPITPHQLNPDFRYLIFHFHRKTKTFSAQDSLATLSTK